MVAAGAPGAIAVVRVGGRTIRHATRQVVVIVNGGAFDHDAPVSAAMREVLVAAYCGR